MAITPIQNVWFDDAATLAMGEAFDHACKSLRNFGSAVSAIIADLIIKAAKDGERDPARLYEQALKIFGIEDMSMPLVSVGSGLPSQPMLRSRSSVILESPVNPLSRALASAALAYYVY